MNRIKEMRTKRGMTQVQLANALGVNEVTIVRYETGGRKPKLEQLKKIASVLDCSFLDLIDDNTIEKDVIKYVKTHWNIDLEPL